MPRKFNIKKNNTYFCQYCNFYTNRISNFTRHNVTQKHINNVSLIEGVNDISDGDSASCHREKVDLQVGTDHDINDQCVPVNDTLSESENSDCSFYDEDNTEPLDDFADEVSGATGVQVNSDAEWYPYESRLHFLLSILHSSKTHKVSDEILSFFLYILKECGVKNVPSLVKVKSFWTENLQLEDMIQQNEDENGNIHWMLKPSSLLKLAIANPNTAKLIDRYPQTETTSLPIPQSSGEKWKEMKFHWGKKVCGTEFVLGEVVQFTRGEEILFGKIKQFIHDREEKNLCVEVEEIRPYNLTADGRERYLVIVDEQHIIPIEECNKYTIADNIRIYKRVQDDFVLLTERERQTFLETTSIYTGKPVVSMPLNIFMDDLSANQSRRWAPMHGVQAQVSGLPLEEKTKNKHTLVLSASETTSMMDLMKPICEDIRICKEIGIDAYDAFLKREVTVTSDIAAILTDYQMMSLVCNHMGPSANKFCPKCYADKSDPLRVWNSRTSECTQRTLQRLAINNNSGNLQKQTGVKLYNNCLWEYIDPHRDTPIGILHFLYLGLAKHLIKHCVNMLSDSQMDLLILHLKSMDQSDFSYKIKANSFFKYLDSRQGKDYKHYLQIAPFNMDYVGLRRTNVEALEKLALISKHMYQQNLPDYSEFQEYMQFVKDHIPELGNKSKTHFCVHMADDIQRHGHPLHFAEDAFEKNHKAIRSALFHQNGHAKSRDTIVQFAKSELTKHVVSGGFIPVGNEWKQAGTSVHLYGKEKRVQSFLGVPEVKEKHMPGQLRKIARSASRKPKEDEHLLTAEEKHMASVVTERNISCAKLYSCKNSITRSGDCAEVGFFVLYICDGKVHAGSLQKLVLVHINKEIFELAFLRKSVTLDPSKEIQILRGTDDAAAVLTSDILHRLHVVHDCKGGKCRKVERNASTFLQHNDVHRVFFINKFRLSKLADTLDFL